MVSFFCCIDIKRITSVCLYATPAVVTLLSITFLLSFSFVLKLDVQCVLFPVGLILTTGNVSEMFHFGCLIFSFFFNRLQLYDLVECKVQGDGNCQVGLILSFTFKFLYLKLSKFCMTTCFSSLL